MNTAFFWLVIACRLPPRRSSTSSGAWGRTGIPTAARRRWSAGSRSWCLLATWIPFGLAAQEVGARGRSTFSVEAILLQLDGISLVLAATVLAVGHGGRAPLRAVHGRRGRGGEILRHAAGHDGRDDRPGLRRRPLQPVGLVRGHGGVVVPAGRVLPRAAGLAGSGHEVPGAERARLGAGPAGHRPGPGPDRHAEPGQDPDGHPGRLAGACWRPGRCS